MTSEDFSRALILSSRLYPLLSNKYLGPIFIIIMAKLAARRTIRLVNRLDAFNNNVQG